MNRYLRFIVHQRIGEESRQSGLFSAAYHLRDRGELLGYERARLDELLTWFRSELTIPPEGTIPDQAIFWYTNVGPFAARMWELAQLLEECGLSTEQLTGGFIGRIVYQDRYQCAAIPPRRGHR
jgi:hypothetical protein